jgi:hypothetical protein
LFKAAPVGIKWCPSLQATILNFERNLVFQRELHDSSVLVELCSGLSSSQCSRTCFFFVVTSIQ